MAKPDDIVKESWGTWEELLLACAVNRHGTNSWDSVAMEIQNRTTSSLHLLTPQNCKQKYHDLKGRFITKDDETLVGDDESEHLDDKIDEIPWLEELRKLRVAELRREVQRYDVSIVSLQLKVKKLKDAREQSFREKENDEQKPDLETDSDGKERVKEDEKERDAKSEKSTPEKVAGVSVTGEDSDRENQSFNESNSTDPKVQNQEEDVAEAEKKPVPVEIAVERPDLVSGDSKPVGEGSYHGSSETIAKGSAPLPVGKSPGANTVREAGESPELWESVAESKGGGEEGQKESSDVQSSASLSKKNSRKKVISGSSSGEEPEADEVSPAIKNISVKSQPLMSFLEIIRSHKYGSIFERRLESQETAKYRNLVRQHVDLEMVRTRLEEGHYSGGNGGKFFRDLLLLFNNASVFFPKNSHECVAAVALRQLVSKELAIRARNLGRPKDESATAAAPEPPVPPPAKPEPPDSQLAKPNSSVPVIACRKRSAISTKPSIAVIDKKVEQRTSAGAEEKPVPDRKQSGSFPNVVEEQSLTKKRTRERSGLGTRSSRTGGKSRTITNNSNKNPTTDSDQHHSHGPNSSSAGKGSAQDEEPKTEKKSNTTVAKKRSAANFLNRMKRNSSSSGTLLETLKNTVNNSNNSKGGGGGGGGELGTEQKRGGGKSDGRKDHGGRQSSSGKQAAEQSSPAKRSVGRPPKRATAAPPPPLPRSAPSKRTREAADTEVVVASRQSRKRARR
ncbi:nuclear receptor corepressor 2-like [Macadamia integrifolia]|uniref:nuclear receptor corepressor 2-like n=1 Tax=Macadamia integrifolia TaxID=60698 RepID=UPI001C4EE921|nr:nuclear receptor corepressor 2-like [Macadamia integrifolia]